MNFFERQHAQMKALLEPQRVKELEVGYPWQTYTEALYLATWPECSSIRLAFLIQNSIDGAISWLIGAASMQNPNLQLPLLAEYMKKGRQAYWLIGRKHQHAAFFDCGHWLYEAGLKNPMLNLLDLEQPGKLADFFSMVNERKAIK